MFNIPSYYPMEILLEGQVMVRPVFLIDGFDLWSPWQTFTWSTTLKKSEHLRHWSFGAYSVPTYHISLVAFTLQLISIAHWNPCFTRILLTVHVYIFQHRKPLDPSTFSRLNPKFPFHGNSFSLTVLLSENFLSSAIHSFFCLLMPRDFITCLSFVCSRAGPKYCKP